MMVAMDVMMSMAEAFNSSYSASQINMMMWHYLSWLQLMKRKE